MSGAPGPPHTLLHRQSTRCGQTAFWASGLVPPLHVLAVQGPLGIFEPSCGARDLSTPVPGPVAPSHSSLSPCPFVLGGPAMLSSAGPWTLCLKSLLSLAF